MSGSQSVDPRGRSSREVVVVGGGGDGGALWPIYQKAVAVPATAIVPAGACCRSLATARSSLFTMSAPVWAFLVKHRTVPVAGPVPDRWILPRGHVKCRHSGKENNAIKGPHAGLESGSVCRSRYLWLPHPARGKPGVLHCGYPEPRGTWCTCKRRDRRRSNKSFSCRRHQGTACSASVATILPPPPYCTTLPSPFPGPPPPRLAAPPPSALLCFSACLGYSQWP